ncbi:ROK family protein [Streptomyces sp. NBC_01218]|uniref:ROK family protein n=1 Tax=unclassified Streptomyces TaxID=2593676 RepID=UPI0023B9DC55|nr:MULTISPECIES: ROK family protein [unclassified Streptomyces]WEH43128.1 ROK family protein [Streptomyces sp. AM 2-1-1]WSQ54764.1 ROK family protein [Streptomyces sp. NBC_01218]
MALTTPPARGGGPTGTGRPATPVVGLDLGGTKIAAALFAADGTVLARHTRPTPAEDGASAVLDALAGAAAEVDPGGLATVLGIAAAGVVDPRSGTVTSATDSIAGWAGTRLGPGLADRTGLPVACDNDVRATAGPELAALGDPHGSLLFAAVGTGVGGAVAVDGRMLQGAGGVAGHLGHMASADAAGLPCTCGAEATGHLEVIASGPGITAHYERLTGALVDRLETVAARAAGGDRAAVLAITTGATALGRVLGGLANALGPDRVVVGGGVPRIGPVYGRALTAAFTAELMPPLRGRLVPEPPLFGHDAAVLGAAALTTSLPLHHPGVAR